MRSLVAIVPQIVAVAPTVFLRLITTGVAGEVNAVELGDTAVVVVVAVIVVASCWLVAIVVPDAALVVPSSTTSIAASS